MTDIVLEIPTNLTRYRERVSEAMGDFLADREGKLYEMVNYHLGFAGPGANGKLQGKAIRSSLALFTTEALGGNPNDALPAAVSLELIHNFSLVHDDIQDDARTRRGRESVQHRWSPEQAINAGDGLKDLSLLALTELSSTDRNGRTVKAFDALTRYSLRMIKGQVMDLDYTERTDVNIDGYLEMICNKTCALLEGSFHLGGIYSDASEEEIEKLVSFGRLLGYVFQIRDDWLGIWGEPEESGKSAKSDLVEKKRSFPVVYAFQQGTGETLSRLKELYYADGKLNENEITEIKSILEELGAREETNAYAEKYWNQAMECLGSMGLADWAKDDLEKFGTFLLNRQK